MSVGVVGNVPARISGYIETFEGGCHLHIWHVGPREHLEILIPNRFEGDIRTEENCSIVSGQILGFLYGIVGVGVC